MSRQVMAELVVVRPRLVVVAAALQSSLSAVVSVRQMRWAWGLLEPVGLAAAVSAYQEVLQA